MKHFLFLSCSIVLASLLSACGSQPAQMVYQIPKSNASQQCFITQSESYIWLEQEEQWNELPEAAKQQFESAKIDFSKESILIISAGQKTSAGYGLELTNWLLEQDHWQVTRVARQPSYVDARSGTGRRPRSDRAVIAHHSFFLHYENVTN